MEQKRCQECGGTFATSKKLQIFCGDKCRHKNNYQRKYQRKTEIKFTLEKKEQVEKLRADGKGYKIISKELGLACSTVKNFCTRHGINGDVGACEKMVAKYRQEGFESFLYNFKEKYGDRYEYIDGYVNERSYITIKCLKCGDISTRSAQMAKPSKKTNAQCKNCLGIEKQREKELRRQEKEHRLI